MSQIIVLKCVCLYWSVYSNQFKATSKPNNKTNCKCTSCVYTNHYVFDLNPSFVFLFLYANFQLVVEGAKRCALSLLGPNSLVLIPTQIDFQMENEQGLSCCLAIRKQTLCSIVVLYHRYLCQRF